MPIKSKYFIGVNIPIDPKNIAKFCFFWWFYVRLGLLYNILKVGQNWSMGKCQISKMTLFDFTHRFPLTSVTLTLSIFTINKKILDFYPDFQGQPFTRHPHHPLSLDHFFILSQLPSWQCPHALVHSSPCFLHIHRRVMHPSKQLQ